MSSFTTILLILFVLYKYDNISARTFKIRLKFPIAIHGGDAVDISVHPYNAFITGFFLQSKARGNFAGTIISTRHVLSCAKMLVAVGNVSVRIGSSFLNSGGLTYTSDSFAIHPYYSYSSYKNGTRGYDVAVATMSQEMKLDGIKARAIPIHHRGIPPGSEVNVSGWSYYSKTNQSKTHLSEATVIMVSETECQKIYPNNNLTNLYCAGLPKGGKSACSVDIGGPAVVDGKLIGIMTNIGGNCQEPPFGIVNITSLAVKEWIEEVMDPSLIPKPKEHYCGNPKLDYYF